MTAQEIRDCLATMAILVDTREQPTERMARRMDMTGLPWERQKLDYGDYSCKCRLPDGSELDFSKHVAIERKMSLDELCMCFGKERKRFEREFERAAADGCRIYLIVEDGSWEKAYHGRYQSRLNAKALVASIGAFRARYGMQVDFCRSEITGMLIRDILYRELREFLTQEG